MTREQYLEVIKIDRIKHKSEDLKKGLQLLKKNNNINIDDSIITIYFIPFLTTLKSENSVYYREFLKILSDFTDKTIKRCEENLKNI